MGGKQQNKRYGIKTYNIDISTPAAPLDAIAPDGIEEARRLRPRLFIFAWSRSLRDFIWENIQNVLACSEWVDHKK